MVAAIKMRESRSANIGKMQLLHAQVRRWLCAPRQRTKSRPIANFPKNAGRVWRELGALAYVEGIGEDVPMGKLTSFLQAVKRDETAVLAWILDASRAERDGINAACMQDARIAGADPQSMAIDTRRMFCGGFDPLISL